MTHVKCWMCSNSCSYALNCTTCNALEGAQDKFWKSPPRVQIYFLLISKRPCGVYILTVNNSNQSPYCNSGRVCCLWLHRLFSVLGFPQNYDKCFPASPIMSEISVNISSETGAYTTTVAPPPLSVCRPRPQGQKAKKL